MLRTSASGSPCSACPTIKAFRAPELPSRRCWPSGRRFRKASTSWPRPRCLWRSRPPVGASTSSAWGNGQTLLVYGAGTVIGFAAVQMAFMRGTRVIAVAGETFAERLRALGVEVTSYGNGMVERVLEIASGAPDLIFDAGPISDVLPDLVRIAGGDAHRVLTVSNHGPAAEKLGVHTSFESGLRYDVLANFVKLAGEGQFAVPVARTFLLERWREALDLSLSGHAHGKLILLSTSGHARD